MEVFIEIRSPKDGRLHPPTYLMFCLLHEFAHAVAPQDPAHGSIFYGAFARVLQSAEDLGLFRMPLLKGKDDKGRGKQGKGKGKGKEHKGKRKGGKGKETNCDADCKDELGDVRFSRKNVKACDGAEVGTKKALPDYSCCPSDIKTKLSARTISLAVA